MASLTTSHTQGMGEEQLQAALSAPELARFLDRVSFTWVPGVCGALKAPGFRV